MIYWIHLLGLIHGTLPVYVNGAHPTSLKMWPSDNSDWDNARRMQGITTRTSNLKNTVLVLIYLHIYTAGYGVEGVEFRLHHVWILTSHVLVKSPPSCTTLDLQLRFYHPLWYNSIAPCPLLQCLGTSGILAGAHSYFMVSSFKCEEKIAAMT
jgi:hypothetical protein